MDFTAKNFRYVTAEFGNFAQRIEQGDKLYLRALSHEKPSEQPAVLAEDFPSLAPDFVLPAQLSHVAENLFSSVLRMSGPVNMWLHYDVSDPQCSFAGLPSALLVVLFLSRLLPALPFHITSSFYAPIYFPPYLLRLIRFMI
jgi:tRNA wybutosine-synthesizing protein 4